MGTRGQQLLNIVLGNLQKDPQHYAKLVAGGGENADPTACSANATVLSESLAVPGSIVVLPHTNFQACEKAIRKALADDKIVAIGISPDHHFVLLPLLSGTDLALLQAFQSRKRGDGSGMTLFEWMEFEKYQMPIDAFLMSLRFLIGSGSAGPRKGSASSLFSMSGKEDYVEEYFTTPVSFKYCGSLEPITL